MRVWGAGASIASVLARHLQGNKAHFTAGARDERCAVLEKREKGLPTASAGHEGAPGVQRAGGLSWGLWIQALGQWSPTGWPSVGRGAIGI